MQRSECFSQAVSDQKVYYAFEYSAYMHYGSVTEPQINLDLVNNFDLLPLILDVKCALNGSSAIQSVLFCESVILGPFSLFASRTFSSNYWLEQQSLAIMLLEGLVSGHIAIWEFQRIARCHLRTCARFCSSAQGIRSMSRPTSHSYVTQISAQ